jgi:uncharacterized protein
MTDTISGQAFVCHPTEILHLEPLSFWGGVDAQTGMVIDKSHPQYGVSLAGKVVQMPSARGSSSSSSVLAECIRLGTAPRAMILERPDPIVLVGALVALELYGLQMAVVVSTDIFAK